MFIIISAKNYNKQNNYSFKYINHPFEYALSIKYTLLSKNFCVRNANFCVFSFILKFEQ